RLPRAGRATRGPRLDRCGADPAGHPAHPAGSHARHALATPLSAFPPPRAPVPGTLGNVLASRVHGIANPRLGLLPAAFAAAAALALLAPVGAVEQPGSGPATGAPPPAWPTSPFHGVISGATGEPIPCRCRFQGAAYRLGDTVCMSTHLGVQLARCDLFMNNTSWIPI